MRDFIRRNKSAALDTRTVESNIAANRLHRAAAWLRKELEVLTKDDNEILTRVGPGTPMGDLMRQYWMPSMMSSELPSPDCPPVRIRILGENLIAFRTSSGKVGVIQNACPHR